MGISFGASKAREKALTVVRAANACIQLRGSSLFRVGNFILRTTGVSPYDNPGAKSRPVIREKVLFPKEKS